MAAAALNHRHHPLPDFKSLVEKVKSAVEIFKYAGDFLSYQDRLNKKFLPSHHTRDVSGFKLKKKEVDRLYYIQKYTLNDTSYFSLICRLNKGGNHYFVKVCAKRHYDYSFGQTGEGSIFITEEPHILYHSFLMQFQKADSCLLNSLREDGYHVSEIENQIPCHEDNHGPTSLKEICWGTVHSNSQSLYPLMAELPETLKRDTQEFCLGEDVRQANTHMPLFYF